MSIGIKETGRIYFCTSSSQPSDNYANLYISDIWNELIIALNPIGNTINLLHIWLKNRLLIIRGIFSQGLNIHSSNLTTNGTKSYRADRKVEIMTTGEFMILVICLIVYLIYRGYKEAQFNNYDMRNIDTNAITRDRYVNDVSPTQIRRNVVAGKYDKK